MDDLNTPSEDADFFGFATPNAGIAKIHCSILAFFGTNGDVGDMAVLDSLQTYIKKQPAIHIKITTAMIKNAEHMYVGEEKQVAEVITKWANNIPRVDKSR